jgi:hypothetical protein
MRKLIATALAAGAMAAGGAASAQDFGSVIANIFGVGTPTYSYGYGTPAVVAGSTQIYADSWGRRFYYDQYGRQVYLSSAPQQPYAGYDAWGRPIYGSGYYAYGGRYGSYGGRNWDRDGDGVANARDRWPNDPRYW